MEKLRSRRRIQMAETYLLYESLFLRAVTIYEGFCEEFFFRLLREEITYAKSKKIRPVVPQCASIRDIVLYGDNYLDWISYKKWEPRVSLFLKDGRPFSSIGQPTKDKITRIALIRDAIAHKSKHAIGKFRKNVVGNLPLLPHEKSPAGFLRSELSPGRKRFQAYLEDLVDIAENLYGKPR